MKYNGFIAVILSLVLAVSCAERTTDKYEDMENASLEAWMKINIGSGYEQIADGLYIQWIERGNGPAVEAGKWVSYDYKSSLLDGSIFYSRSKEDATNMGNVNPRTHYVPYYVAFTDPNRSIAEKAIHEALKKMNQGDSVLIYAVSSLTYGSATYPSDNSYKYYLSGYEGQSAYRFTGNVPSVFELRLTNIVDEPSDYEKRLVEDYAYTTLGLTPADTVAAHQYYKITDPKSGELVKEDETVKYYYKAYFLDGHIFDSNIDSVIVRMEWRQHPYFSSNDKDTNALSYNGSSSSSSYIKGMDVIKKMKYEEWATTVFISDFGYTYEGQSTSTSGYSPEIRPYTPLVFDIYVVKPEETQE